MRLLLFAGCAAKRVSNKFRFQQGIFICSANLEESKKGLAFLGIAGRETDETLGSGGGEDENKKLVQKKSCWRA